MITTKTTVAFSLSDENKKEIKEKAQKIKNHLVASGYDDCEDFIVCNDYDCYSFAEETLMKFLPFIKKEIDYIDKYDAEEIVNEVDSAIKNIKPSVTKDDFSEGDAMVDFLDSKYTKEALIEKIIEYDDEEFLKILFNNNQE